MILSWTHGLVLVKTWKTAGTSIERFLSDHVGPDAIVTPIQPHVEGHRARNHDSNKYGITFVNHMPAAKLRAVLGVSVWEQLTSFCVERNPWDQVVSAYFSRRARHDPSLTWNRFIEDRKFFLNHRQSTEPDDRRSVIVNKVLRYEQLASDLTEVMEEVGIPFSGSLDVRAKASYRTDRRHYRERYTDRQAEIVVAEFANEIAIHGYEF